MNGGDVMKPETVNRMLSVYEIESECIREMRDRFDEAAYGKAVELLKNAERIGCTGCGHSGILCQHFAHLMCCIERPAKFISPAEAVHGGTGFLKKGDVCLFAYRGGKTKELLPILEICRAKGVRVITVTENADSPLAKDADVVLRQYVNRETDRYNCQFNDPRKTSNQTINKIYRNLRIQFLYFNFFILLIKFGFKWFLTTAL